MEIINANDPLVLSTGIMSLINCFKEYKKDRDCWIIYVATPFSKSILQDKMSNLTLFFNTPVDFIVEPSYFPTLSPPSPLKNHDDLQAGRLLGSMLLNEDYINTPFFQGPSNREQCEILDNFLTRSSAKLLLVYSNSGYGKSHMLQKAAYSLWKDRRLRVYFNAASSYIDDLKGAFSKNYDFLSTADYIIIDDVQFLAMERVSFAIPGFFTTLELTDRKKIILSMDKLPDTLFEERIVSRLKSGFVIRLDPPDDLIKENYIDHYSQTHEIVIPEEIKKYIIMSAPTLRVMRGYLQLCEHVYQTAGEITYSGYIVRTEHLGSPTATKLEKNDLVYGRVLNRIRDHFGFIPEQGERKSRTQAKADAIMLYYFTPFIPRNELLERLKMNKAHLAKYFSKGEIEASKLPDEIKVRIGEDIKFCQR